MFDAIRFCRNNNISYRTTGANVGTGWVGVSCPFCGDNNFHGGIKGFSYTCWKCGTHTLADYIKEVLDIPSAYSIIKEYDNEEDVSYEKKEARASSIILPGDLNNEAARNYLRARKFDPEYLESKYKIRYTGITGDLKYRIVIPIFYNGELVSYQARDYTNKQEIRYKTLSVEKSIINPKYLLYNHDFVSGNIIGVCEGPFDAIRMGDGFVATLGTRVTEEQIRKLIVYEKVYILFDPEEEAQERANKLAEKIASFGKEVYVIDTELSHDPGDMTEDEVQEIRDYIRI